MCRLTKLVLLTVLLLGCGRSEQKITRYGEMTLTETFSVPSFDLDARHKPITRSELCTSDKKECFAAKYLIVEAYESPIVGRMVASVQLPLRDQLGPISEFFDTKLGKRIQCDCRFLDEIMFTGQWLNEGRVFMVGGLDESLGHYMQIIEFDGLKAKDRIVHYDADPQYQTDDSKVDEAKTGKAWVACKKTCTMFWINGPLTEVKSRATSCKQYTLKIEWKDGEPELLRRDGGDVDKC